MANPNLFRSGAFVTMAPPASNINQHNQQRSTSFEPMPPPSILKGQAPTPPEDSPPVKRTQSRLGFDSSMNLVRRTTSNVDIPLEQGIAAAAEEEEEEDFVDAPEEQDELVDGGADSAETANIDGEHETAEGMEAARSGDEDEEEDLFASTFGSKANQARQAEDDSDSDSDDSRGVGTKLRTFAKAKDDQAAVAADYTVIKTEHTDTCNGDRGASTPPASSGVKPESSQRASVANKTGNNTRRSTATPAPLPENKEADFVKDKSRALRFHEKFHNKAKQLQPRLPLPSHRYWIGVLHIDRKPTNAKEEKHFTWMKGNRVTTVETIWHTYQMTTMTDGFVLLLGGVEKVDFRDRCEELNHFNDNFICFRAVEATDPASKGHEVGAGCPLPEVIAIDD